MKIFRIFQALAALLLPAVSCSRGPLDSGTEGRGELRIDISGALPSVRVAGDDGELMNSLRVWAVSGDGTVYRHASLNPGNIEQTVTFEDMLLGDYTLYAVANCTALDAYVEDRKIDAAFTDATLPKVDFDAGEFEPSFAGKEGYGRGMPLSYSGPLHVAPGTNNVSISLLRVCGHIDIVVRNHTDRDLVLREMELSEDNPDSGFLFFKDHTLPDGAAYGQFSSLPADGLPPIGPSKEKTVISQYLYETAHDKQLTMRIFGQLVKGIDEPKDFGSLTDEYKLTYIDSYGNPVPLSDLCRNERLTLAVNVYWTGDEARLDFSVASWTPDDDNETTFD